MTQEVYFNRSLESNAFDRFSTTTFGYCTLISVFDRVESHFHG